MALFCSAVPASHDSVTVTQHETEAAKWHSATIDLIAYTCGHLAVTGQNVLASSYGKLFVKCSIKNIKFEYKTILDHLKKHDSVPKLQFSYCCRY